VEIRRLIHKRIRHESPNASVAADVNAVVAVNVGGNGQAKSDNDREGSMEGSEHRGAGDTSPEKRIEEVGRDTSGRPAPIDEDVAGELNAALPEDEADGESDAPAARRPPSPRA